MRKEIEVKAKIENIDVIVKKLEKIGCVISPPAVQEDVIFVDENYGIFTDFQSGKNILRIRKSNGKVLFTLKQPQANEMDAIGHETEINSAEEMRKALVFMGYHEVVRVKKKRRKTNYNGWEICLDEVEGLGSFIEVEKITEEEDGDAGKIQNELFEFLISLGIRKEARVFQGYDTLVYMNQGKS